MSRFLFWSFVVLFLSPLFFEKTLAQSEEKTEAQVFRIATVNVYEPKLSQSEGVINVSYTAHNREGVQSDIRASLLLIDSSDILVQREVDANWFSLGQDEKKQKTIQMRPSEYLQGSFSVYLLLSTGSGITLAQVSVGEAVLSGSSRYIKINGCSLVVGGAEKTFNPGIGIGVSSEESLVAKCSIENLFSEPIKAIASLDEYSRSSSSGKKVASYTRDIQQINVGSQILEFPVEKNKKPQAYTQVLSLLDNNKKVISTQSEFHYVVRGEGATIQNVIFDKTSYLMGDVANVQFSWTGAADPMSGLPDRKYEGTPTSGSIIVHIVDGSNSCSKEHTVSFDASREFFYRDEKIEIERDCKHPSIAVVVKNKDGAILDSRSFQSEVVSSGGSGGDVAEESYKNVFFVFALGLSLAIFSLVVLFFVSKTRRGRGNMWSILFFSFLAGMVFITTKPLTAHADTFVFVPYYWEPYYITVNHNKDSYFPGESAVITSSISQVLCVNGWGTRLGVLDLLRPESKEINRWAVLDFFAGAYYDATSGKWVLPDPRCGDPRSGLGSGHYFSCTTGIRTSNFRVPNLPPGSYNADYRLTSGTVLTTGDGGTPTSNYGYFSMPYRIVDSPRISGRVQNSSGAGYSGVSVSTCVAGVSATTDASGNYSFTVPYDTGFCVRLTPQARPGMTGPAPIGYPASLQWMNSYEFQRAGRYCAAGACGGQWDVHDRAVDTGYDFVYSPAPVTVRGRVSNSNGTPYGGVSVGTCVAGVSATTDANGNYSFTVPYDTGFCVRLTPQARPGVTGPVPTGYPASLQWMNSYEFQRAGRYCTAGACGGQWDVHDRAVDTGYDFVYSPAPVTVRGRITNQAGAGIPGVTIPACAENPGATTDASGNYSFTVPYDARFCIRPSTPVGVSANPLLSGLQLSQRVSTHTYEFQVAGWNAGVHPLCDNFDSVNRIPASCDEWRQWDIASGDMGYDFAYSSLPLPTATLSLNPNPINIHPTAGTPTVRATWSSTNATSCVATSGNGFNTGNATSGVNVVISTPGAVGSYLYSVRCDGPGGSVVASQNLTAVSICNPTTTCTASDICEGKSCNDGCGNVTPGTKDCRKFWKEVAP